MKIAFAGFRHDHILSLYRLAGEHPDLEVVAAAEEDAASRTRLTEAGKVSFTHDNIADMLDNVHCDIVAIGDYYGNRGRIAIEALKRGKHIISDKPLCTSLEELEEIKRLAAEKSLKVGCMFTMRDSAILAAVREFIQSGKLGNILQIQLLAQHPLLFGTRPQWYFQDGMHGGTINDIGCHAFDILPYLTGQKIKAVTAARSWQAKKTDSNFKDAGQFMLELANGCGVMCDVSYSAPDTLGYVHPCYWRFNIWGENGMMEFKASEKQFKLYLNGLDHEEMLPEKADFKENYLDSFLAEIAGEKTIFDSEDVFEASYWSLLTQKISEK